MRGSKEVFAGHRTTSFRHGADEHPKSAEVFVRHCQQSHVFCHDAEGPHFVGGGGTRCSWRGLLSYQAYIPPKSRIERCCLFTPFGCQPASCGDAGVPINRPKFPHQIVEKQPQEEEVEEEEGRTISSLSIISHMKSCRYLLTPNPVEGPSIRPRASHDGICYKGRPTEREMKSLGKNTRVRR